MASMWPRPAAALALLAVTFLMPSVAPEEPGGNSSLGPANKGRPLVHVKTHKTGSSTVHAFFKEAAVANGLPLYFEDGHVEGSGCPGGPAGQQILRDKLREGAGGVTPWITTGHMINARFMLHNDTRYLARECSGPGWFRRVFANFRAAVGSDALVVVAAREPVAHYLSTVQFFAQPNVKSKEPVALTPDVLDAILVSPAWSNPFARELGIGSDEEAREFCHAVEHWARRDIFAVCMETMEQDLQQALRLSCPACVEVPAVEHVMPRAGSGLGVAKEGMEQFLESAGPDTWQRIHSATLLDHILYQCLCPDLSAKHSKETRRSL